MQKELIVPFIDTYKRLKEVWNKIGVQNQKFIDVQKKNVLNRTHNRKPKQEN